MLDPAKAEQALAIGLKMRNAQKKYFKDRARSDLVASKELERRFDKALEELMPEEKGLL